MLIIFQNPALEQAGQTTIITSVLEALTTRTVSTTSRRGSTCRTTPPSSPSSRPRWTWTQTPFSRTSSLPQVSDQFKTLQILADNFLAMTTGSMVELDWDSMQINSVKSDLVRIQGHRRPRA